MAKTEKKKAAQPAAEVVTHRKTRFVKIKKAHLVVASLMLLLAAGGVLAYKEYDKVKKENQSLSDPEQSARIESERVQREVASLIEVPTDEAPTIATVKDVGQLKNQPFYAKAQNGDRVLFYANAKKAILYRPSAKKIIEVATLNITNTQTQQPSQTGTAQPSVDPSATTTP